MSKEKFEWRKMAGHTPLAVDVRICFGIAWFATEEKADEAGKWSAESGNIYNGGFFHGMQCGRDNTWDIKAGEDYDGTPGPLFAATF